MRMRTYIFKNSNTGTGNDLKVQSDKVEFCFTERRKYEIVKGRCNISIGLLLFTMDSRRYLYSKINW